MLNCSDGIQDLCLVQDERCDVTILRVVDEFDETIFDQESSVSHDCMYVTDRFIDTFDLFGSK